MSTNTKTAKHKDAKIPAGETRNVPLSACYLHPLNPRQRVSDEEIDAMALSLDTIGLMQNLLGVEDPNEDGCNIGIVAGGRRLRGLQRMAETKGLNPATVMIPVKLATGKGEAEAWAGAENTARAALHPADEITAYARMIDGGGTIRHVAKAFAVSERHVQGSIKLAGLAQPVLAALKANQITLDQAGAIAICDDHKRQTVVLDHVISWDQSPSEIRSALTREATRMGEGLASFVSRKEYEAAGGAVREDLFGADVYFEDGALLGQLAQTKLDAIAAEVKAEGWRWVEVMPAALDYETLAGFARTYPEQASLPEEAEGEYDDLAAAIEAGEASDEQIARFDEIERALAKEHYSEVQRKIAGACIGFDYNCAVRIERGLVAKSDKQAAITLEVVAPQSSAAKTASSGPYSAALSRDVGSIRTAAVQQALLDQPDLALDLLAFTLHEGGGWHLPLGIKADTARNAPDIVDGFVADDRLHSADRHLSPDPKAVAKRFTAFRKQPQADRTALLTEAVARTLGGGLVDPKANPIFEQVAGLTSASIRTVWTPTEAALFKRMTSAQLDALWCSLLGKKTADNFYRKKADKTAFLHRLFNDAAFLAEYDQTIQDRVMAWVPEGVEISVAKPPRKAKPAAVSKSKRTAQKAAPVAA